MSIALRRRLVASIAMAATIALGLASRHWPGALPAVLGKYPGDALWALMVFFGWRASSPLASTRDIAWRALATSAVVELAKLWRAPWLVAFRHTTIGHLLHVPAWITQRHGMSPPDVGTASPMPIGATRSLSSWIAGPPARLIAPATPPPCASRVLAAFAIASTSSLVMSASRTSTFAIGPE